MKKALLVLAVAISSAACVGVDRRVTLVRDGREYPFLYNALHYRADGCVEYFYAKSSETRLVPIVTACGTDRVLDRY